MPDHVRATVDQVIASLAGQPSTLSGDDSGLGNFWLEYVAQVQGDESAFIGAFEMHLRQTIEGVLLGTAPETMRALWLRTTAGREWLGEADSSENAAPVSQEDVADLVFGAVRYRAADFRDPRIDRFNSTGDDDFHLYSE